MGHTASEPSFCMAFYFWMNLFRFSSIFLREPTVSNFPNQRAVPWAVTFHYSAVSNKTKFHCLPAFLLRFNFVGYVDSPLCFLLWSAGMHVCFCAHHTVSITIALYYSFRCENNAASGCILSIYIALSFSGLFVSTWILELSFFLDLKNAVGFPLEVALNLGYPSRLVIFTMTFASPDVWTVFPLSTVFFDLVNVLKFSL